MNKGIVISFPGGRGYEVPLLYFGAKHFEDMGYEKVFINHPASGEKDFDALFNNAGKVVESINLAEYEDIVFVAKSIGTLVACQIKEKYSLPASLILITPVEGALPYINQDNEILLVAAAERDRHWDTKILQEHCEKEWVKCYVEQNIGHRMEVINDLQRNLEVIANVIGQLK